MPSCRQLSPCFPSDVVKSLSPKDYRLYVLFHGLMWSGLVAFLTCLAVYAVDRSYIYFILPLPCIFVLFAGLFGFRWLAQRNNDKFELHDAAVASEHDAEAARRSTMNSDSAHVTSSSPPPPIYSTEYDGPIFTIYGVLVPPPTYDEATIAAAAEATTAEATTVSAAIVTSPASTTTSVREDASAGGGGSSL